MLCITFSRSQIIFVPSSHVEFPIITKNCAKYHLLQMPVKLTKAFWEDWKWKDGQHKIRIIARLVLLIR